MLGMRSPRHSGWAWDLLKWKLDEIFIGPGAGIIFKINFKDMYLLCPKCYGYCVLIEPQLDSSTTLILRQCILP